MTARNISLLNATYSSVPAVQLPISGGGTATFTEVTDTTATASDVATGKYFYTSAGVKTQGTNSGGGSPTLQDKTVSPATTQQTVQADEGYDGLDTVTVNAMPIGSASPPSSASGTNATSSIAYGTVSLTKSISMTPVVSAGYVSSGTAGNVSVSLSAPLTTVGSQTFYPSTSDQTISTGRYLTGAQTFKAVTTSNLTADNIKNGVTVTVGDSDDADRVVSVTGTYGGGGSSKNSQVVQGTTRTTSSTLTAIGAELTVSKTGTYDVYWSAVRSTTSGSYTYGTQLYINGTAHGTQNTTWSNHVQNNHLTNVSLTANQKLRVYGRNSRGSSYYIYAPTLVIIEV